MPPPTPQHKALFLAAKFGHFVVGNNTTPRPAQGELLVKVETVGLNPVDWGIRKWGLFISKYPAVLGTDVAGVVVEVGAGVTNFSVGDRVLYQGSWSSTRGGFQQYNITDADTTAKVPDFLSFEAAASIPVCIAAAYLGLYNSIPHGAGYSPPLEPSACGKYAGTPLFVFGGSSSVGQFVLQLGKLSGFSPIITTASLQHEEYLKTLGATHVLDRRLPLSSLQECIRSIIATDTSLELVFDAVSTAETQKAGYEILAPGGSMVVLLQPHPGVVTEAGTDSGKKIVQACAVPALPQTGHARAGMYSRLGEWLRDGIVRPNRVEILPPGLEAIAEGLSRLEKGQVSKTKLVARPQLTGIGVGSTSSKKDVQIRIQDVLDTKLKEIVYPDKYPVKKRFGFLNGRTRATMV